jgi:hypothetical protein
MVQINSIIRQVFSFAIRASVVSSPQKETRTWSKYTPPTMPTIQRQSITKYLPLSSASHILERLAISLLRVLNYIIKPSQSNLSHFCRLN